MKKVRDTTCIVCEKPIKVSVGENESGRRLLPGESRHELRPKNCVTCCSHCSRILVRITNRIKMKKRGY